MKNDLLIKDARLFHPDCDLIVDLHIEDGVIRAIGTGLRHAKLPLLCADGRTLLPAFVDLHTHFRDPGYPHKEDITTGSRAAAGGGYTAVSVMANTDPVCDHPEVAEYMHRRAEEAGLVEVYPVGAISRGLLGEKLSDMEGLAPYVWAYSDDGIGVEDDALMLRACQKAASLDRVVIPHCEYADIADKGLAERLMVARDLLLARHTECRLHVAHVSTAETVEMIVQAREGGGGLTCEVTPHHLCLDRAEADYTVNPPIADRSTRDSLVQSLAEGRIDVIATDHAPHTAADKERGAPGISGIETAFPLLYTRLVKTGLLPLADLVRYMSTHPARIMGLNKGELRVGDDGDVVLIEEDGAFTVNEGTFLSMGSNSPLIGMPLQGKIWATVHKGELIYIDGKVKGRDFDDHRQAV